LHGQFEFLELGLYLDLGVARRQLVEDGVIEDAIPNGIQKTTSKVKPMTAKRSII